jgi:hypothetical protein
VPIDARPDRVSEHFLSVRVAEGPARRRHGKIRQSFRRKAA